MASIFKKGRDKSKRRSVWYVSYDDENGKRRMRKGFTDRALTEQLAAKLENEVMLRKRGLIDPDVEKLTAQKRAPLTGHLDAFERSLGKNTGKHVKLTMSRVRKVVDGCGFETPADINAEAVEQFLEETQAEEEFGHRTYNHYVQAIDSFCNWMVGAKKIPSNPLVGLERLNADVDVRHRRRALSSDEVAKLVESARSSGVEIQCFDGERRARIYILSYMTGLRRKEIASLTPRSFSLDGEPAVVRVEAACSKHRKMDVLPLHAELVIMLREWLAGMEPDQLLFPKLAKRRTWLMVKKDLERIGIAYETAEGIADFHAAGRHSHITGLVRNGASLPEAQKLARHADIKMTMRYTHIGMADQAKAIQLLGWQRIGSGNGGSEGQSVSADGTARVAESEAIKSENPCGNRGYDADRHSLSLDDKSGEKWRRRESNPRPETFPRPLLRA
jgi:site-specific recombinase XerD